MQLISAAEQGAFCSAWQCQLVSHPSRKFTGGNHGQRAGEWAAADFDGDPSMPLMWYLRDELGLTGTKFGCGVALCGACTVHLNGEAVRACGVPMSDVGGKSVVTIEGLDPKGEHPVQVAWRNLGVPQCGYCQTGQIMQAAALLGQSPRRATRKSPTRCPAISAAAAATSASMRPSAPPRRERDMTYSTPTANS